MSNRKIRCAIYTRKSSEEGLEQEFNSLDAQHEACAAYVASQRHGNWYPSDMMMVDYPVAHWSAPPGKPCWRTLRPGTLI